VIAAHNKCVNGLIADICKYQVKRCALRFVSEDKEKSLKSLWKDKALKSICSQEELWAAAADGERRRNQERQEQEGNELSEEEMEQLRPQRRRSLFGDTTTEVAQARCMNITRSLPVHTAATSTISRKESQDLSTRTPRDEHAVRSTRYSMAFRSRTLSRNRRTRSAHRSKTVTSPGAEHYCYLLWCSTYVALETNPPLVALTQHDAPLNQERKLRPHPP
jgi:hypothetical protein